MRTIALNSAFRPRAIPGNTVTSQPRRIRTRLSVAMVAAVTALTLGAYPAWAAYYLVGTDNFSFYTSNSKVKASGAVKWYSDDGTLCTILDSCVRRGEYSSTSKAVLQASGCLYVQVVWYTMTGTVSWPPAVSGTATSTGYYKKCGSAGTTLSFSGVAYASRTLWKTCVNLGYSSTSSGVRGYDSNKCMLFG